MSDLARIVWPLSSLPDAIAIVARRNGLPPRPGAKVGAAGDWIGADEKLVGQWIETTARQFGLEAEPVGSAYADLAAFVRGAGPAILRIPGTRALDEIRFVVLLKGRSDRVMALGPDLREHRVNATTLVAALRGGAEAPIIAEIDQLLSAAGIPRRRQKHARNAILEQRLADVTIRNCWMLRLPPSASFFAQMRSLGLIPRFISFLALHSLQYAIFIASWAVLGFGVLHGRIEPGWLLAWALLLITVIPLRMLEAWWQGLLAIDIGALLKQRLLYGALRLEPEETRHQGIGQLLGSVLESDAVENLALAGALVNVVGVVELFAAAVVLALGAGGLLHMAALVIWASASAYLARRYFLSRRDWTAHRLDITHDMVEQMVGHRTRLAQQPEQRWHEAEDQFLPAYVEFSRRMDRAAVHLNLLVPRGWLVVGLLGVAPAFVFGQAPTAAIAVGIGGVLLAYRAFTRLSVGLNALAGAVVAWQRASKLFDAAAREQSQPAVVWTPPATANAATRPTVLEAHNLVYRYGDRAEPALQNCSLQIQAGERLLLEGPSGGGKSTLGAVFTGLREANSGLLLLHGLDRRTMGSDSWRRRVVAAPTFRDNFVLTETFAFNLLMGRGWPPTSQEDFTEAEAICSELGLDKLIARMPSGLMQMVGETGWQLSHGEKSRLYMARALLQSADVVILDESFAALDPETLQLAMRCALKRARTLLLIAHP
jgi:ATP-binding cassette, subfamily B, bacterial